MLNLRARKQQRNRRHTRRARQIIVLRVEARKLAGLSLSYATVLHETSAAAHGEGAPRNARWVHGLTNLIHPAIEAYHRPAPMALPIMTATTTIMIQRITREIADGLAVFTG